MYYFKHIFFLLFLTIPFSITNAQIREFTHPKIISFEHSTDPVTAGKNSKVSLSNKHYKHLGHTECTDFYQSTDRLLVSKSKSQRNFAFYFHILDLQPESYLFGKT